VHICFCHFAMVLLFQCQSPLAVPVTVHKTNTTACGVGFWLPSSWSFDIVKDKSSCTVGLIPPGIKASINGYPMEFTVMKGTLNDLLSRYGFSYEGGRWRTYINSGEGQVSKIAFGPWHGMFGGTQFRSLNEDGSYGGVGEGTSIVLVDGRGNAIGATGLGVLGSTPLWELVCSIEPNGKS
jgi:hypothetical protein